MRKIFITIILMSFVIVSCVETSMSKLEKQAIETFKTSFGILGEDGQEVQFDNLKTVFLSNNLCILNADVSSNKGTNKVEYLFLTLDGKNYEAYQNLDVDSIFVSESTFNHICKGTIYENQDYATAILFRSINHINAYGREVGNHKTDFFINSPLKTGAWELCGVVDEFGDVADGKCLRLVGKGIYSTEDEDDEKLLALLFVGDNGNSCYLKLIKNDSYVFKFFTEIKIKDGDGEVHEISFEDINGDGSIVPYWNKGYQEFRAILDKEGVLSALADVSSGGLFSSSSRCTYKFKFNLRGFKNAMRFLQPNKSDYDEHDKNLESDDEESISDEKLEADKEKIKFKIESESNVETTESEILTPKNKDENSSEYAESNSRVFDVVEQMPSFPGGPSALFEYLSKNIRYPVDAEENGIQGRVIVSFIVECDGSITDPRVVKSVDPLLDKEAQRVVMSMPRWIPGKQNGSVVRVKYTVPVTFRL